MLPRNNITLHRFPDVYYTVRRYLEGILPFPLHGDGRLPVYEVQYGVSVTVIRVEL
jgi:hypothetical protein